MSPLQSKSPLSSRSSLCVALFAAASLIAAGCGGPEGEVVLSEEEEGVGETNDNEVGDELGEDAQAITASYASGVALDAIRAVNLRRGPSTSDGIIRTIPYGARVYTVRSGGAQNGYYNVKYGGSTGWAHGAFLQSNSKLLKWGMYPDASDAMKQIGLTYNDIWQTIGNATASAGTHARDGYANGLPYTAATDIRPNGRSVAELQALLEALGRKGFAGWYRRPCYDGWPCGEVAHLHVIYVGAPAMKSSLKSQVNSWLAGRNGLVSNTDYRFYNWSSTALNTVRTQYTLVH